MAVGSNDKSLPLDPWGNARLAPTGRVAFSSCRESTEATQTR